MKSTKMSVTRSETDEETPSNETLERRKDRKLKDDITNLMYRLEMDNIKPSFDVVLQTGTHRGLYSHNLYKKRRPLTSTSLHEDIEEVSRPGHDRHHGVGKDNVTESRYYADWHPRPSTSYGDSEKLKTYQRELDSGAPSMTNFRDLPPESQYKTLETDDNRIASVRSKTKADTSPGSSLSAMLMRASRLSTDDLKNTSPSWNTYATLPRSSQYRHYPGAAVISMEELPLPQRGTYIVKTEKMFTAGHDGKDDATESRYSGDWHSRPLSVYGDSEKLKMYEKEHDSGTRWMTNFRDLSPAHDYKTLETGDNRMASVRSKMKTDVSPGSSLSAMVMRASGLSADNLNNTSPSWNTYATLPRSSQYRHYPGAAVISMEELPLPQRGTYIVEPEITTLTAGDDDRAWTGGSVGWRLSSAQSNGPHLWVRPLRVHDDELMSYLHEAESAPTDFTLNAIVARQEGSKHQPQFMQSVDASTGHLYTVDDEILQLRRLLDNPFAGYEYERSLPKQQITFSDNYSLPYTPKTIITSPSLVMTTY